MNRVLEQRGTQLHKFGRCAMMGALIGLTTTQAFAASAPAAAGTPETTSVESSPATQAIETASTENMKLAVAEDQKAADNVLPEAPNAPEEVASLNKPLNIKAIMDDAAQNTNNLQSAPTQQKRQIHPGWLAVTAVGALAFAIGIVPMVRGAGRGEGLAATFVGVGAGLSGLGLYLTFK